MVVRPNITRWLAVPTRAGGAHGDQPNRRVLLPAGVIAVAIAATAAVALGAGQGSGGAAAEKTSKDGGSDYLQPVGVLIARGTVPKPALRGDQGAVGVPPATPARPTKPVDLAVGRTAAQYSGRAGTLTPAGIATLAMQRGCSSTQAVIATAVAMAESGGSPSAQGDVSLMDGTWDWSAGLWQIRGLRAQRGTGALRDAVANQNAVTNSVAMYAISSGCTSWSPWSTYNTGAYRAYLAVATRAVNYVVGYYQANHRYPAVAPPDPNATVPIPAGGGYGATTADPAAAAAGSGTSAKKSSAAKAKPASSSTAARSSAAAGGGNAGTTGGGGSGGGNTGGGNTGGGSSNAAPAPAKSTPKPVDKVTSAAGGVVSKVASVLPTPTKTPCVPVPPLVKC